ncbi:hypothetical protein BBJ28_00026634 [Nothophytophthora sp. Chile5]|nr:hypothetical protein BBJ28_00026634 [Nothophytophthora sp. Chile5]
MRFLSPSSISSANHKWPKRIPLRGIERFGVTVDGVSTKCMHHILVSGDVATLLQFLPTAVMRAFNRHPRMRTLVLKDDLFMAEIQPPISLADVTTKNLLSVREFSSPEAGDWKNWGQFVEEQCQIGFKRFEQFMFQFVVWVDRERKQARLMLFSDHIVSDGDSGQVIANDILEDAALLSLKAAEPVEEFPLRPSLYEMWFPW